MEVLKVINIKEEIRSEGHSPLRVLCQDYQEYFVKNTRSKTPPFEILNEFLCSQMLHKWQIPTPEAKLISVPESILTDDLSSNHHKRYYQDLCFGSKAIDAIDVSDIFVTIDIKSFNKLINPKDFCRIVLFDNWVHNDDRKPSNYNLILKPTGGKFEINAIDHAFVFESLGYSQFCEVPYCPSATDHLLVSEIGQLIKHYLKIDEAYIAQERDYFYLCLSQAEKEFTTFAEDLSNHFNIQMVEFEKLYDSLFDEDRNTKVFQEHVYRLKQ